MIAAALLVLSATPSALAAPTRLVATAEFGTSVRDLALGASGRWLAATESGGGAVHLVDTWTWTDTTIAACGAVRGVAIEDTAEGGALLATGCGDGRVLLVDVDPDGAPTLRADPLDMGEGAILGVELDGARVYAVVDPTSGNPQLAAYDVDAGALVTPGYPSTLGATGVADTALVGSLAFVVHGSDKVSKVDLGTGAASVTSENLGSRDFVDAWAYTSGTVYLADENGSLCVLNAGGNDLSILRDDLADSVTSVTGDATSGWMLVGASDGVHVYDFAGGPGDEVGVIDGATGIVELVGAGNYAYGGTSGGNLVVLSGAPWVTATTAEDGPFATGDTVPLSVTSDTAGDVTVRVGGTLTAPGSIVAETTIEAGETLDLDVDVTASFGEGVNRVWVFVRGTPVAGEGVREGHAAASVTVDRAPGAVVLTPDSLGFGDGRLLLRAEGLTDADLDHYTIYVSTEAFDGADWPTGGPDVDGTPGLTAPFEVDAAPGEALDIEIAPLENGTTYFVGVRAVDAGGKEGPMSTVVSGTPQPTFSASQLAGDEGFGCATGGPGGGGGSMALLAGVLALAQARGRRRDVPVQVATVSSDARGRRCGGGGSPLRPQNPTPYALAVLTLALAPLSAHAGGFRQHAELSWGPETLTDTPLVQVYGASSPGTTRVAYGVGGKLWDVSARAGAVHRAGTQVAAAGRASSEEATLWEVPASFDATLRLDVLREGVQPLVPFAGAGAGYLLWREAWDDGGEVSETVVGGRPTWNVAAGAALRLDALDPASASSLEAAAGIRDSWLVGTWRRTTTLQDAGLDFSSTDWSVALRVDW